MCKCTGCTKATNVYIELFRPLISISIPLFENLFFFWKAVSLNPSVGLSMWQLQSPILWSGLSILSPTSWLFKRAKAQQCSFLNTQIHVHQVRDHCLAKEPPAPSLRLVHPLSLAFSSPWTLHLSLSTLLHRPQYTQIGASPSSCSSVSVTQRIFHHSSHSLLVSWTTLYLSPSPADDFRYPLSSPSAPSQYS